MFGSNSELKFGTYISPNCGKRVNVAYAAMASSIHALYGMQLFINSNRF